jgi:hypothetical protein
VVVWAADKPVIRAYAQYFLGVLMVTQRVTGGNTTYFMGEVSASGWKTYFPVMYLAKETIVFHLFTLIALIWAITKIKFEPLGKFRQASREFFVNYLPQSAMAIFLAIYWISSVSGNLNIGVRHLMPVFPLTMALAAGGVAAFANHGRGRVIAISLLCLAQMIIAIKTYPFYLSYFNAASGGSANGYKIAVDSNLDWGQDLKRLKNWLNEKNIGSIYVDYFGGADAKYYLGDKFQSWWGDRNPQELPSGSYLAVSATLLQGGRGRVSVGSDLKSDNYKWLNAYEPVAVIGNSIFVYRIE